MSDDEIDSLRHDGQVRCRLCRGSLEPTDKTYLTGLGNVVSVRVCSECGSLDLLPSAEEYPVGDNRIEELLAAGLTRFAPIAESISAYVSTRKNPQAILEIGGGPGLFLSILENLVPGNLELIGLEPSLTGRLIPELSRATWIQDYFPSPLLPSQIRFDACISIETLEHIQDPINFLREVFLSMSEDSIFVLTTPSAEAWAGQRSASRERAIISPGFHTVVFSEQALRKALEDAGWQSVAISRDEDSWVASCLRFSEGIGPFEHSVGTEDSVGSHQRIVEPWLRDVAGSESRIREFRQMALDWLAWSYSLVGDWNEAHKCLSDFHKLKTGLTPRSLAETQESLLGPGDTSPRTAYVLAMVASQLGKRDIALRAFEASLNAMLPQQAFRPFLSANQLREMQGLVLNPFLSELFIQVYLNWEVALVGGQLPSVDNQQIADLLADSDSVWRTELLLVELAQSRSVEFGTIDLARLETAMGRQEALEPRRAYVFFNTLGLLKSNSGDTTDSLRLFLRALHGLVELETWSSEDIQRWNESRHHILNVAPAISRALSPNGPLVDLDASDGCRQGISVIIPVFANAKGLGRAVASVLAQTFPPQEVVLIASSLTEESEVKLREAQADLRDAGVTTRVLVVAGRVGQSMARNVGALRAKSCTLAFLDQDDEWMPFHLEQGIKLMESTNFAVSPARGVVVDENGQTLVVQSALRSDYLETGFESIGSLLANDLMALPSGMLVDRDLFLELGGFDEGLSGYEDDDLIGRAHLGGVEIARNKEPSINYTIHGSSLEQVQRNADSRKHFFSVWMERLSSDSWYLELDRKQLLTRLIRNAILELVASRRSGRESNVFIIVEGLQKMAGKPSLRFSLFCLMLRNRHLTLLLTAALRFSKSSRSAIRARALGLID